MHIRNLLAKLIIPFLTMVILFVNINLPYANCGPDQLCDKHMYELKWKKMSQLISRMGYPDFVDDYLERRSWDAVSRNNDGTSIRIINRNSKRAIILNCDGSVKHIKLSSLYSWFDNNDNVLSWSEHGMQNSIKYLKGKRPSAIGALDPSGQYFISNINPDKGFAEVYAVAKPNIPLAHANIIAPDGLTVFFKNNKLYVFGYSVKGLDNPLKGFIYKKEDDKFRLVDEFEIPREKKYASPYLVEDMNPWGTEILLRDERYFPLFSKWYIYNLSTKKLEYLGLAKDRGLFLQCDILEKMEQKLKERQD